MTEEEYKAAVKKKKRLEKEIEALDKKILKYDNEHKPEFLKIEDVRNFIMYESVVGSLFKFEDKTYVVEEDYEDIRMEYGCESVDDGMSTATMEDLNGGRLSLIAIKDLDGGNLSLLAIKDD